MFNLAHFFHLKKKDARVDDKFLKDAFTKLNKSFIGYWVFILLSLLEAVFHLFSIWIVWSHYHIVEKEQLDKYFRYNEDEE